MTGRRIAATISLAAVGLVGTACGQASDGGPAAEPGVVTCPRCGSESRERMPENACLVRWHCPACGSEIRPRSGDCCVFCSHGSRPCPPERASGGG